ncbi:hypothetical protein B0H14DRAFT_3145779 [Mycena olivaceomarginata]|nr:hypothetical protein B0H14DRAFT_3145779 [Mycena olivaceomarginata]
MQYPTLGIWQTWLVRRERDLLVPRSFTIEPATLAELTRTRSAGKNTTSPGRHLVSRRYCLHDVRVEPSCTSYCAVSSDDPTYRVTACSFGVYNVLHVQSMTDLSFKLRILDTMITTLRPLLYALLASTDPSLLRAIRSLYPNSSPQPSSSSSSSSSSSPPSQLTLPTLNLTAPSSSCTTGSPHSSDKWGKTISVKQNAAACSRDNHNQPITSEDEASQKEHDNVALQI